MLFTVDRLDHLVIPCADLEQIASWYQRVLGMEREADESIHRTAVKFGGQKIIFHAIGSRIEPCAIHIAPGSADICLITAVGADEIMGHLMSCGVGIERGPVSRLGALGPITSICCRDAEGNLVEIASYMTRST